jgi:hypothetical protein
MVALRSLTMQASIRTECAAQSVKTFRGQEKSNQENLVQKMQPQGRTAARKQDQGKRRSGAHFGEGHRTDHPDGAKGPRQLGRTAATRHNKVAIAFVAIIGMTRERFGRTRMVFYVAMATHGWLILCPIAVNVLRVRVVPAAAPKQMDEDQTHRKVVHQPVHLRSRIKEDLKYHYSSRPGPSVP